MHELIPKETFRTGWEYYWSSFQDSPGKVFWNADPAEAVQDVATFKDYFRAGLPLVDVGCGNGTHTRALATQCHFTKIIATDVASAAIAEAPHVKGCPISYRTLDLLRPEEAVTLHREISDANVHIRGVLHQLPYAYRKTAVASVAQLMGDSGTLYLKELSPAAETYLTDLIERFGPVEGLERSVGVLHKVGIHWGSFSESDIETLFPPDRFTLLACLRTLSLVAFDLAKLAFLSVRCHKSPAAENLFLRKQLGSSRSVRSNRGERTMRPAG
jgi:hypothetical protein